MVGIHIDLSKKIGSFKALHGVNNGPVCYGSLVDVSQYYKELCIPCVRLHDTNWPHPREVDIHTIFPNFDEDENDPENYDFRRTDEYIKSVIDTGARIIYRLGVSIEHTVKTYYTDPPKDYKKWARICIGIIKHYNQGWANGFRYGIKHWEIWNEPDNPGRNCMWSGTMEEYFELYRVAATEIKQFDPKLKVGGFAATMVNPDFTNAFLAFCENNKLPLDFFSWHTYTDNPLSIVTNAHMVKGLLDKHNFVHTESHFNEWNYSSSDPEIKVVFRNGNEYYTEKYFERSKREEGASFDAAVLILLQDCPVDIANFYDAAPSSYWSLFNAYGVPQKNYYAFKAFKELSKNKQRMKVEFSSKIDGLYCGSGINETEDEIAVLISNFNSESRSCCISFENIVHSGVWNSETYLLDSEHNLELVNTNEIVMPCDGITQNIGMHSVVLLKIKKLINNSIAKCK